MGGAERLLSAYRVSVQVASKALEIETVRDGWATQRDLLTLGRDLKNGQKGNIPFRRILPRFLKNLEGKKVDQIASDSCSKQ